MSLKNIKWKEPTTQNYIHLQEIFRKNPHRIQGNLVIVRAGQGEDQGQSIIGVFCVDKNKKPKLKSGQKLSNGYCYTGLIS